MPELRTPLLPSVTFANRVIVDAPATAVEVPVSVTAHVVAPEAAICGWPIEEVIPAGNTDERVRLAPAVVLGPLAPFTGVAVTLNAAVPGV